MPDSETFVAKRTSRRSMIGQASGVALTGALAMGMQSGPAQSTTATPQASPEANVALDQEAISAFLDQVAATMDIFGVPGAAVAIVRGSDIVASAGFGQANLEEATAVDVHTRFRIGSNTKSMSTLMLATLVDEGVFDWDTRAIDLWPQFLAPTPELTANLRLRDLLGMGSGIAESPTIEFFMSDGTVSAVDLLHTTPYLPVIGPPDTEFYYNNTLICDGAYLGLLAAGVALETLSESYSTTMHERVFGPIGMTDASLLADPRVLVGPSATGYTTDLNGTQYPVPFISINGAAPVGQGLASVQDMARYIITQKNAGVTPDGSQLVSAANLAITHEPGILVPSGFPVPADITPDTAESHYALGWFVDAYHDGRRLIWHAGGIDGFSSWMGFWPEADLGLVVLSNLEPGQGGGLFTFALREHFTGRFLGLNEAGAAMLEDLPNQVAKIQQPMVDMMGPVNPDIITPYLGYYSDGFTLRWEAPGDLRLQHDIRSLPIAALADGTYVITRGPGVIARQPFTLGRTADLIPTINLTGFEPITWQTGLDDTAGRTHATVR